MVRVSPPRGFDQMSMNERFESKEEKIPNIWKSSKCLKWAKVCAMKMRMKAMARHFHKKYFSLISQMFSCFIESMTYYMNVSPNNIKVVHVHKDFFPSYS